MEKNEVFTFTSNEVEIKAIIVDCLESTFEGVIDSICWTKKYLCYAQNRLFYYIVQTIINKVIDDDFTLSNNEETDWYYAIKYHSHDVITENVYQEILVEHCIIPDYDKILSL